MEERTGVCVLQGLTPVHFHDVRGCGKLQETLRVTPSASANAAPIGSRLRTVEKNTFRRDESLEDLVLLVLIMLGHELEL